MLALSSSIQVYIAAGVTDMRKSFDTLAGLVVNELGMDPLSGQLFAFCNRKRDRVKVLYWDQTGYCLLAKRLERGRFAWPKADASRSSIQMTTEDLAQILGWVETATEKRGGWYNWNAPQGGHVSQGN